MDINILSTLLQQFIKESGKASIPGFGSFILKEIPSEFLEDGGTIMPPQKWIVFESTYSNDGLLESTYSRMYDVPIEKSRSEINSLSIQMKKELMSGYKLNMPHFGVLYFNEGYEFSFIPDESLNYLVDNLGLEPIIFSKENGSFVFDESSDVVSETSSEVSSEAYEDNIPAIPIDSAADIIPDTSMDESFDVVSEVSSDNNEVLKGEDIDEKEDEKKDKKEDKKEENEIIDCRQNSEEQEIDSELNLNMEPDNVKVISSDLEIKHKQESTQESTNILGKYMEHKYDYYVEEEVKEKYKKFLLFLMWVIIVLIFLAVIVFIFQEQFRPILEKIFYTKEELDIIMFFRQ